MEDIYEMYIIFLNSTKANEKINFVNSYNIALLIILNLPKNLKNLESNFNEFQTDEIHWFHKKICREI